MKNRQKQQARRLRAGRVRRQIRRYSTLPRLSVYRSLKHVYAQIIDDQKGITLVAVNDRQLGKIVGKTKTEIAGLVGEALGEKAKDKKISKIVFDRGPFAYFGRIRALAAGARKKGLDF